MVPVSHKTTLSVFISAYNEEENIRQFLESLVRQREEGYLIHDIHVISDASSDRTAEFARKVKDSRIQVTESPKRRGKSYHVNKFFESSMSDILIIFDADVDLDAPETLGNLIEPIIKNSDVGLVGGNARVSPGQTFIENAVNSTCLAFDKFRVLHNEGSNPFGANGCIMALSRNFAQNVHIPENMIANDQFLYFSCIKQGFRFVHQRNAIAWYRSPSTLSDQIRQNTRFMASHEVMRRIFGDDAVTIYHVPTKLYWRVVLRQLFRSPIYSLTMFIVNRYCQLKARKAVDTLNARWPMAKSTKKIHAIH